MALSESPKSWVVLPTSLNGYDLHVSDGVVCRVKMSRHGLVLSVVLCLLSPGGLSGFWDVGGL